MTTTKNTKKGFSGLMMIIIASVIFSIIALLYSQGEGSAIKSNGANIVGVNSSFQKEFDNLKSLIDSYDDNRGSLPANFGALYASNGGIANIDAVSDKIYRADQTTRWTDVTGVGTEGIFYKLTEGVLIGYDKTNVATTNSYKIIIYFSDFSTSDTVKAELGKKLCSSLQAKAGLTRTVCVGNTVDTVYTTASDINVTAQTFAGTGSNYKVVAQFFK